MTKPPFRPTCLGQLRDDSHEIEIWIGINDEVEIIDLNNNREILIPRELFERMLAMIQVEDILNNSEGNK